MKQGTLKELHCPYCGSPFELIDKFDIYGEDVIHGIAKCNCRRYPIVSGILVLNILNLNALNQALRELERRQPKLALLQLLEPTTKVSRVIRAAKHRGVPFSTALEKLRTKLTQCYLNRFLCLDSFSSMIDYFKFISFGGYFKYRFSGSSFICGIPLTLLMNYFAGPVLEIGCGMGHHGFIISQLYPQRRLVLTDSAFINLYLAKRFFAPQAEYVCLNANEPLPFADQSFSTVFSSDALHYLHSKKLAIWEIGRVSKTNNALILLSHLHNLEEENPVAGEPLTALGWLDLVSFGQAKLFPETQVLENFLNEDKLDLLYDSTGGGIEKENAFVLVATSRPGVFRVYENIGGPFFNLRSHPIVNPLYHLLFKDSEVLLQKRWPSKFMRAENINIDRILPENLSLNKQIFKKLRPPTSLADSGLFLAKFQWLRKFYTFLYHKKIIENKSLELDVSTVAELMKKFVLINVPAHY